MEEEWSEIPERNMRIKRELEESVRFFIMNMFLIKHHYYSLHSI